MSFEKIINKLKSFKNLNNTDRQFIQYNVDKHGLYDYLYAWESKIKGFSFNKNKEIYFGKNDEYKNNFMKFINLFKDLDPSADLIYLLKHVDFNYSWNLFVQIMNDLNDANLLEGNLTLISRLDELSKNKELVLYEKIKMICHEFRINDMDHIIEIIVTNSRYFKIYPSLNVVQSNLNQHLLKEFAIQTDLSKFNELKYLFDYMVSKNIPIDINPLYEYATLSKGVLKEVLEPYVTINDDEKIDIFNKMHKKNKKDLSLILEVIDIKKARLNSDDFNEFMVSLYNEITDDIKLTIYKDYYHLLPFADKVNFFKFLLNDRVVGVNEPPNLMNLNYLYDSHKMRYLDEDLSQLFMKNNTASIHIKDKKEMRSLLELVYRKQAYTIINPFIIDENKPYFFETLKKSMNANKINNNMNIYVIRQIAMSPFIKHIIDNQNVIAILKEYFNLLSKEDQSLIKRIKSSVDHIINNYVDDADLAKSIIAKLELSVVLPINDLLRTIEIDLDNRKQVDQFNMDTHNSIDFQ